MSDPDRLHELQLTWVRTEATSLLDRSHTTMMQVLLGQVLTLVAGLLRGSDRDLLPLAGLAILLSSVAGAYYSLGCIAHSRFLHSLLIQLDGRLWFPQVMRGLRTWAAEDRTSGEPKRPRVKRPGWEERSILAGYLVGPTAILGIQLLEFLGEITPIGVALPLASVVSIIALRFLVGWRIKVYEPHWKAYLDAPSCAARPPAPSPHNELPEQGTSQ